MNHITHPFYYIFKTEIEHLVKEGQDIPAELFKKMEEAKRLEDQAVEFIKLELSTNRAWERRITARARKSTLRNYKVGA